MIALGSGVEPEARRVAIPVRLSLIHRFLADRPQEHRRPSHMA